MIRDLSWASVLHQQRQYPIMEDAIVLYPSPGIGHLISMVELGKYILKHHPSFSITVIITDVPYTTGSTAPYIAAVSKTIPSITFHHLPPICPPPIPSSPADIPRLSFEIPHLNNANLHKTLTSISQSKKHIKAFIIDFFCSAAMEVSKELCIPTYYFFSSGGYGLALFLYSPTIDKTIAKSMKDLNMKIHDIPSLPPIHSTDMPDLMFDRSRKVYDYFIRTSKLMQDSAGVIVNTFKEFEKKAIDTIGKGVCVPDGRTPPVYCLGPLISTSDDDERHSCLNWLDSQPSQSVLFLCFGSLGLFSVEQLKEIAIGLERSEVRFLWVVRNPPPPPPPIAVANGGPQPPIAVANGGPPPPIAVANGGPPPPPPLLELDSLLPEGFLERTKDRGYVVKDWAPQVAVISHGSIGGFVTHCGWNSILESVCAGVPMLAWPLYAEQKLNRAIIVEEIKVALRFKESENGFVTATELEERVRELMNSEKAKAIKDRVKAFKDGSMAANSDGGSSRVDLAKFVQVIKQS